jgi:hypothetical protein
MARVKAKKRKATKECIHKKKVEKIRPIIYVGEGFQNRAFQDFWSLPLSLLAMGPQILEGLILKPFSIKNEHHPCVLEKHGSECYGNMNCFLGG